MASSDSTWPAFSSPAWPDTYATLHMWTQIVGKIKLKLSPRVNHFWGAALQLCARGLTTLTMPHERGAFELSVTHVDPPGSWRIVICMRRRLVVVAAALLGMCSPAYASQLVDLDATSVQLATLLDDGPTGGYFHLGQPLPW